MEKSAKITFILIIVITLSSAHLSTQHRQDEKLGVSGDEMLQFTAGGHILGFRKGDVFIASGDHALRIEFVNARPASPVNEGTSPDTENNRQTAEPLGRVSYSDLWDGVTLVYERRGTGVVKSTYTIQPEGTDASSPADRIRLRYNVPVAVDGSGNLVFSFETGQMKESRPVAWQEIKGKHIPVEVSFRLLSEREIGFKVGSYDPEFPLVIDPVLIWNTFMGSSDFDYGNAIAVDTSGNVYVAGSSFSTWGTPVNPHAGSAGFSDAFVAKLNSSGVRQWHTFMGAAIYGDIGYGIAVDGAGNVYVMGWSQTTWGSPINPHAGIGNEVFAAKLNSSGVRQWNTFMGSSDYDYGWAIAVDGSGNAYVAGESSATWGSPVNPHTGFNLDAFAAKLNSSGVRQWNTFMGSTDSDIGYSIAVDSSGNVYVAGRSSATWSSPVNAHAGLDDVFAAKLNSSGVRQWHTFMGSAKDDIGVGIAVDSSGNVYVAGSSSETWGTPVYPFAASSDVFAAKLNSSGARQWNTFMGSFSDDGGGGIAVDPSGNVYMAGTSDSTWGTPVNPFNAIRDTFAAKLDGSGVRQWNTFMGSSSNDYGYAIAMDTSGNVYVAGNSSANWGTPINPHKGGGLYDAFAAKIDVTSYYVFDGHDFDGNGTSDIAVFRPSNGYWYIKDQSYVQWGLSNDIPTPGDYNGDGTTDIAVFRPSNGYWYIKDQVYVQWGLSTDIPVPGDYNGDGITDIAVYRPSNGYWYIKDQSYVQWGLSTDIPVPGDYNGDGITDIAVYRPSNGYWYIKDQVYVQWGLITDIPVLGDYNGDGITDIAVFRPSNGYWYVKDQTECQWGLSSDIPTPGDYNGDGSTDIAVFRPSNGYWYIKDQVYVQWGLCDDIALVR